ncbi:YdcF family protein [Paenarthrobacter sp. JL.01a]|uniref:YdcF family protein n=1 Tax=Paenarthrobacter sp. JL.01a TaxID=2979324 RepID=UPI0021C93223|nr:YdcF family protein [Paenarthrobacter sp. JL.01a]UXM90752.1 YdcF family protein [Paenarthrobacter sp. JL.01a]
MTFRRKVAWTVIAGVLAGLLWLVGAYQLFHNPPHATPQRTDAIVVLGGMSDERLPVGLSLREQLDIPDLVVVTTGLPANAGSDEYCQTHDGDAHLDCFRPDPLNTRGEAVRLRELAAERGWKSVTVVTSDYHVLRAGTLMKQCIAADVQMVGTEPQLSPAGWLWRFVVETGGLFDVWIRPEC